MCVHALYIFTECGHSLFAGPALLPCSLKPSPPAADARRGSLGGREDAAAAEPAETATAEPPAGPPSLPATAPPPAPPTPSSPSATTTAAGAPPICSQPRAHPFRTLAVPRPCAACAAARSAGLASARALAAAGTGVATAERRRRWRASVVRPSASAYASFAASLGGGGSRAAAAGIIGEIGMGILGPAVWRLKGKGEEVDWRAWGRGREWEERRRDGGGAATGREVEWERKKERLRGREVVRWEVVGQAEDE